MKKIVFSVLILCTLWITVSIINAEFFTNIEESAKSGNVKKLQTLVNNNTDKDLVRSAIDYAVKYNRIEAFKFLLEFVDEKQYVFILNVSLECGNVEATKLLLEKGGPMTSIDKQFANALSFEMVKLLLNKGVVINTNINLDVYTQKQRNEIISIAMKNKKLVPVKFWRNALRIAVSKNDLMMAEPLKRSILEMKNNKLATEEFWDDVFCIAIENNDQEMVEELKSYISKKVVPRALSDAIGMNNEKLIDYLLEIRPDLGLDDATGAACSSIVHNRLDIFENLLNNTEKFDEMKMDSIVRTAIDENKPTVIDMLSKKGFYVNKEWFTHLIYEPDISPDVCNKIFNNYSEADLKEIRRNITIEKNLLEWFRFPEKKKYDKALKFIDKYIVTYPQVQTH